MKRLLYLTAVTLVCTFVFNIGLCSNVMAASFSGTAVVEESVKQSTTDDFEIDEYGVLNKYTGSDSHVIIPEGVVSIGSRAFLNGLKFLNQVTIPDSVTSIEDSAFCYCATLTGIIIPDSITSIGYDAFLYCVRLKSITIPDGVTRIEDNTFSHCTSLTDIKLPSSMTYIGLQAFWKCTSLKSITIPDGVTEIGWGAFDECESLTDVFIPESVIKIGNQAFENCPNLTIYGKTGSYAEQYATENGMPFNTISMNL